MNNEYNREQAKQQYAIDKIKMLSLIMENSYEKVWEKIEVLSNPKKRVYARLIYQEVGGRIPSDRNKKLKEMWERS